MTVMKKAKFKSDAFEAIHSAANGMFRTGVIGKATMRDFDSTCLAPVKSFKASEIKKIRQRNNLSQPVFAVYLNTSESTIEKWETGVKHPSGMALKLLSIVEKHGIRVLA